MVGFDRQHPNRSADDAAVVHGPGGFTGERRDTPPGELEHERGPSGMIETMTIPRLLPVAAIVAVCGGSGIPGASARTHDPLRILVTNDDGVKAPGLDQLVEALRRVRDVKVTVVAPLGNQSGSAGRTTVGPVTARRTTTRSGYPAWAVAGYPADSIRFALAHVVRRASVDLVIAGINQGSNLGPFVDASGTVGAARAAARVGLPALATSEGTIATSSFSAGVRSTITWLRANRSRLRPGVAQNLNTPQCSAGHVRGTAHVTMSPKFALGLLLRVDCTQTTGPARDDVGAYLQGFATLTTLPTKPA